jgi:hypothetical protein
MTVEIFLGTDPTERVVVNEETGERRKIGTPLDPWDPEGMLAAVPVTGEDGSTYWHVLLSDEQAATRIKAGRVMRPISQCRRQWMGVRNKEVARARHVYAGRGGVEDHERKSVFRADAVERKREEISDIDRPGVGGNLIERRG